jgi:hypothetical protein
MRQNNTLLFAAVFDRTDLLLRTPISAGVRMRRYIPPVANLQHRRPMASRAFDAADPSHLPPAFRADSLSKSGPLWQRHPTTQAFTDTHLVDSRAIEPPTSPALDPWLHSPRTTARAG